MKLEKTFHDEIQQIFKLSSLIKAIPWTAGESSRSKSSGKWVIKSNKCADVVYGRPLSYSGFFMFLIFSNPEIIGMNDAHGETICCKFDIALVNALE